MKETLPAIMERIHAAARKSGRPPEAVKLVAVGKTVTADRIKAAVAAGVTIIGENYIQEALGKIESLAGTPVVWHFIGHLQSNKARQAAAAFDLIQTVDSIKLARAIDRQAEKLGRTVNMLIQVNISREAAKSGVATTDLIPLLEALRHMPHVAVKGLMTLPPFFDDPEKSRPFFARLRELKERIAAMRMDHIAMDELSMGMSGDFEAAIEEGATLVRIGRAIFGSRP